MIEYEVKLLQFVAMYHRFKTIIRSMHWVEGERIVHICLNIPNNQYKLK